MCRISSAKRMKRTHGFTLIELLVVVAIIAVLVAIMMPALSKSRDQAKAVACLSNVKSMGMAFFAYSTEWESYSPACDFVRNASSSPFYGYNWLNVAAPYMGIARINDAKWVDVAKITTCPASTRTTGAIRRDYALNMQMLKQYGSNMGQGPFKLNRLESPSNAVTLYDAGYTSLASSVWVSYKKDTELSVAPSGYGPGSTYYFAEVHQGKANVLFYDWHVESSNFLGVTKRSWIAPWW